jgi:hypothetical protein
MANRRSLLSLGAEWVGLTILAAILIAIGVPLWARLIAGVLLIWLLIHMMLEGLVGRRCPNCVEPALEHAKGASLGWRYSTCRECGARWYRSVLGAWRDAGDPAFDAYFGGKASGDPWHGGPVVDEATGADGTHGTLLQNKKSRQRKPRTAAVRPDPPTPGSPPPGAIEA